MFNMVDFPEPDGPMMAMNEPASMVRSTPARARTIFSSPRTYVFSKPSMRMMRPPDSGGPAADARLEVERGWIIGARGAGRIACLDRSGGRRAVPRGLPSAGVAGASVPAAGPWTLPATGAAETFAHGGKLLVVQFAVAVLVEPLQSFLFAHSWPGIGAGPAGCGAKAGDHSRTHRFALGVIELAVTVFVELLEHFRGVKVSA